MNHAAAYSGIGDTKAGQDLVVPFPNRIEHHTHTHTHRQLTVQDSISSRLVTYPTGH